MIAIDPCRLEAAVISLCPEIENRVSAAKHVLDDRQLWWELSCCVMSSQVEYSLAVEVADAIFDSGLLLDCSLTDLEMTAELEQVLGRPFHAGDKERFYRFPRLRARQIAATHGAVISTYGSLEALISNFRDSFSARTWFVDNAPGLGPKQASMFLRNVGISYDLAILDRHVLYYMTTMGISDSSTKSIATLEEYCREEDALRQHAKKLGYPVGMLDWAIWIVMRVAGKQQMEFRFR